MKSLVPMFLIIFGCVLLFGCVSKEGDLENKSADARTELISKEMETINEYLPKEYSQLRFIANDDREL
ncbi:hypothetical protein [Flagellimonas myxillae]|uniref:hypothetical protein n=1 Tax=Flagellimonas myxillae TaxID=2942214 RepID=UPI00201ED57C|nr:hypothetical protein [Muricauda myxillae]MCL6265703.1 hypothetical protein [Muricauda myxillae]